LGLYIFILAAFLGFHIISRVPPLLHTPLMSATNAISGISLIGSLVVAGGKYGTLSTILGTIAVTCSSVNVVGGFLITDRMLKMFKSERDAAAQRRWFQPGPGALAVLGVLLAALVAVVVWFGDITAYLADPDNRMEVLKYLYIVSAVLFIFGLKG